MVPKKPGKKQLSDNAPRPSHVGPLQSNGLTEMEMIERAINTKPPPKRARESKKNDPK